MSNDGSAASAATEKKNGFRLQFLPDVLLGFLTIAYLLVFIRLSWLKHATFHANSFDLGIFVREVWGLREGYSTIPLQENAHIMQDHFTPILYPLAWLSHLIPPVPLLLGIQTLAFGLSTVFLYRLAKRWLTSWIALLLSWVYLMHPALQNANLFEFHTTSLAVFFLSAFLYFWCTTRLKTSLIFLLLALMCREEVSGILFLFCLGYALKRHRIAWLGVGFSLLWAAVAIYLKLQVPEVAHNQLAFASGSEGWLRSIWDNLGGIIIAIGCFGFLPLLGARQMWPATVLIAYMIFSPQNEYGAVEFHYLSTLLPFFFVAAAYALQMKPFFLRRLPQALKILSAFMIMSSILGHTFYSLAPWVASDGYLRFQPDAYSQEAERIVDTIPPKASVVAPIRIVAHVATREWIFSGVIAGPDFVILEQSPNRTRGESLEDFEKRRRLTAHAVEDMTTRFGYRVLHKGELLTLLKRRNQVTHD